jgi:hypothetical protein
MAKKNRYTRPSDLAKFTSDEPAVTEIDSDLDPVESEVEATVNQSDSELIENTSDDDVLVDGSDLEADVDGSEPDAIQEDEVALEEEAELDQEDEEYEEYEEDSFESDEVPFDAEAEDDQATEISSSWVETEIDESEYVEDMAPEYSIQETKRNYRPFGKKKSKNFDSSNFYVQSESVSTEPRRAPAEIQREIDQLLRTQAALDSEHEKLSRNMSESERAMQEFAQFVTKVENSIAWRLKTKFEANLKSADADIERIMQVSSEIDVSDVGYLVKLRRLFLRRFWKATFFATLAIAIFVALQYFLQDSENSIARFIVDYPLSSFVTSVLILWTSSIFTFIVWYYKTWSSYERSLRLSEVKLLWVRDSLQQAQESKSKLTKLYAHAEQWIGLIALSLHHPWQTDPKWEQASGSILSDEKLPNAVTVAQAVEGSAGAMAALERTAVARLLRPGWREQIFMRQIAAVAKHQGIQQDKYNIETFDKDSPSIPNGSRNFFVSNFRDPKVQLAVARSYLSELSIEVQTVGLLESKPPVKNDYVDDLSAISEDLDMLGEVEIDQAWDGFLLDIVGNERDPIIPISPFSFTDRAVIENAHGLPNVHIQMPMRLRSLTESLESNRVLLSAYEDSARLPLDLVVRVDYVGPLEPEMLKLWSKPDASATPARPATEQSETKVSANCSNCGRRECPAATPGSNVACTYSGV